jgi:hypothetical protein
VKALLSLSIDNPTYQLLIAVDESLSQTATGINASVNIEVDKEASLSIVIDKANGISRLKGEQLTGGIDPSGKQHLRVDTN